MPNGGIVQGTYNIAQDLLIRGTSVWVRVGTTNSATDLKTIGFVDSMSGSKNLQLQRAQVCGSIMVASIDAQGISVQISISGFVATKDVYNQVITYNGGGDSSILTFQPSSGNEIIKGNITKFPYMDFYDESHNYIIAAFTDVIPSTYKITVNGGSYIKADVTMEATDMAGNTNYQIGNK